MTKPLNASEEKLLQAMLRRDDIRPRVQDDFAGGPLGQGVRSSRAKSYDHCYNYFVETADLDADLEKSCAVLGFYLASWGMFRGSSYLLQCTNSSDLGPVVQIVQQQRQQLQAIDVDQYSKDNVEAICKAYEDIRSALRLGNHRPITVVTKIMAGVFGCIPAFDRNFTTGLRSTLGRHAKLSTEQLTARSLQLVKVFYLANQSDIDALHRESRTAAFGGGTVKDRHLTRAKIVDMYCFEVGDKPTRGTTEVVSC